MNRVIVIKLYHPYTQFVDVGTGMDSLARIASSWCGWSIRPAWLVCLALDRHQDGQGKNIMPPLQAIRGITSSS